MLLRALRELEIALGCGLALGFFIRAVRTEDEQFWLRIFFVVCATSIVWLLVLGMRPARRRAR